MDIWSKTFDAVKAKLSPQQCATAVAVLGDSAPEITEHCIDYKSVASDIMNRVYVPVLDDIKEVMDGLSAELADLQGYRRAVDLQAAERKFLTPRMSRALMEDTEAWFNPSVLSGKKVKPIGNDWLDTAIRTAQPNSYQNNNHYGRHNLKPGKTNI